jgi:nucleoside-diphosphate-sugar epimerase
MLGYAERVRLVLGAGYTGSRVAQLALARGEEVLAVVRSQERERALAALGIPVTREKVTEIARRLAGPDVHAIICFPPDGETDAVLAPLLAPAGAVSYLSTTGVYGDLEGTINDTTPLPTDDGPRQRAEAAYRAVSGTVLRAPGIYGPDRGLHVRVVRGLHLMPGDGANVNSRIHVEDLAELLLQSRKVRGETFVVADQTPTPQRDLVAWICKEHGCPMPRSVPPAEVHETLRRSRHIDASRALSVLGVTLRYPSYEDGMRKGASAPIQP